MDIHTFITTSHLWNLPYLMANNSTLILWHYGIYIYTYSETLVYTWKCLGLPNVQKILTKTNSKNHKKARWNWLDSSPSGWSLIIFSSAPSANAYREIRHRASGAKWKNSWERWLGHHQSLPWESTTVKILEVIPLWKTNIAMDFPNFLKRKCIFNPGPFSSQRAVRLPGCTPYF